MGRSSGKADKDQIRIVTPEESRMVEILSDDHLVDVVGDLADESSVIWMVYRPDDEIVVELWADTKPPLEYLEQRGWEADMMIKPNDLDD